MTWQPQPPPLRLDDPAEAAFFDELPLWSAPFGLALLEAVRLHRHARVLDLGHGAGFPLLELAQRLGPTCRAWGLDPWRAAALRAAEKARLLGGGRVGVALGVAERMPFADGAFTLVVSNNGVNNVQDAEAALAECFRVSRPGAQLLLTMNLPATMQSFYEEMLALLRERGLSDRCDAVRDHIARRRRTRDETEVLLRQAGFTIEDVREEAFRMRYLDAASLFGHGFVRQAFLGGWLEIVPEPHRMGFFEALEQRLDRVAADRGELSLEIPFACYDCRRP